MVTIIVCLVSVLAGVLISIYFYSFIKYRQDKQRVKEYLDDERYKRIAKSVFEEEWTIRKYIIFREVRTMVDSYKKEDTPSHRKEATPNENQTSPIRSRIKTQQTNGI